MKEKILKRCDHVGLLTNNCKKLADFYISKLNFKKEKEEILPRSVARPIFGLPSDFIFIRLVSGNMKLELFQPTSLSLLKHRRRNAGFNHWGYCVADRKRFAKALERKNIPIIEIKRNAHFIYFIKDPDGNLVEIRD